MTFRGSKKLPLEGWGCLVERASFLFGFPLPFLP